MLCYHALHCLEKKTLIFVSNNPLFHKIYRISGQKYQMEITDMYVYSRIDAVPLQPDLC